MTRTLLAGLGHLFAPIGSFFNSMVLARNTDKTAIVSLKQQEMQRETANQKLKQEREIAEKQQLTQLKLACLNIQYETALEERRQDFQVNLEMSRQQFQERMEHLRFGQQLTLEQARQAFQLKLNVLNHQQQQEIQQFIQSVNWAINQKNLDFQKWRFEQEKALQQELAAYNRETQLAIAAYQRETAFQLPEVHKLFENWPLRIVPSQILNSYQGDGLMPLRVIISPPEVDFDRFGNNAAQGGFPKIEKRLAEELGQFLDRYYSLNNPIRPTRFSDGAWDTKRFHGGASIEALFWMLKSVPTLVLESEVDGDCVNFRVAYWGAGQESYCYQRIISRLPYRDILYESAKARALKWKTQVRDKLLARGKTLEEVNKNYGGDNAINLTILEEDEEFKQDGIEIPRHYQVNREDWEYLCQVLVTCHCLVAGWITDAHYLINQNVLPLLPELLPNLIDDESGLPVPEVVQAIVSGYRDVFKAIEIEQPYWIPELHLHLAQGLTHLPDKCWAKEQVVRSIQSLLQMRGVSQLEVVSDIEVMKSVLAVGDDEYFEKLNQCLKSLGKENRVLEGNALLNTWRKLKIRGDIKVDKKGQTLF